MGQTLAALLHQRGVCVVQDLYSRTPASAEQAARFVGAGRVAPSLAAMRPADLWLISVSDGQIADVAAQLAEAQGQALKGAVAWHNSGFLSAEVLAPLQAVGASTASVHPVLSFANPASAMAQFADRNIKFTNGVNEDHPVGVGVKKMQEILAAKTSGKMKITAFWGGSAGGDLQATQALLQAARTGQRQTCPAFSASRNHT